MLDAVGVHVLEDLACARRVQHHVFTRRQRHLHHVVTRQALTLDVVKSVTNTLKNLTVFFF